MSRDSYIHGRQDGAPGGGLLFTFHGTGGDETQLLGLGRALRPQATVVSPRGDVSEGGAARFFRRTGEGVYDMEDLAVRTEAMRGFVRAHRDEGSNGPVYGLGYSNGANILASVLFAEPSLFDGVVLMHPLIPFEPKIEGGLDNKRILVTAGQRDPICPPHLTHRLLSYLRAAGAETEEVWHGGGHEIRPQEMEAARQFLSKERGS